MEFVGSRATSVNFPSPLLFLPTKQETKVGMSVQPPQLNWETTWHIGIDSRVKGVGGRRINELIIHALFLLFLSC